MHIFQCFVFWIRLEIFNKTSMHSFVACRFWWALKTCLALQPCAWLKFPSACLGWKPLKQAVWTPGSVPACGIICDMLIKFKNNVLGPLSHSRRIIFLTQNIGVSRHEVSGKTFIKIPHKNKGGRFGSLRHPAKLLDVTASVAIRPQVPNSQNGQLQLLQNPHSQVFIWICPLDTKEMARGSPPLSPHWFSSWCPLPTTLCPLITDLKYCNARLSLQPQDLARNLKWKLILVHIQSKDFLSDF